VSREGEKISFSEGGGGVNIVFRPKYRPLAEAQSSRRHKAAEGTKQQKLKTAESQNGRRHKTTEAPFGRSFTNIYAY
jgi:hypothetical protein